MMMKSLMKQAARGTAVIAILTVFCAAGCNRKSAAGRGADVAVVPDADVVLWADLAEMRSTDIYSQLEEMRDKQMDGGGPNAKEMQDVADKLKAITGLKDGDFKTVIASAVLEGVDLEGSEFSDVADTLNGVMAVDLAKAVTLDQLEEALKEASASDPDSQLTMTRESYNDSEILVASKVEDGKEESMALATTDDGKVIIAGTMPGTKGALDRAQSGQVGSALEMLKLDAQDVPEFALRFDVTEKMREKMAENNAEAKQQPGNPMAGAAAAFEDLEQVNLQARMSEDLNMILTMALGTEEKAMQAKGVLDNSVLSTVRMVVSMMSGGQPMTILDTLATAADASGNVTLSFTLSSSDLKTIQKASQKQQMPPPQGQ